MEARTACVLGVHSFAARHRRTGIQHLALGLGRLGYEVSYVSAPFTPFDLIGAERRERLWRSARALGHRPVAHPGPGVAEYCFFSPIPLHRLFIRGQAALRVATATMPWREAHVFDLCIHDVGPCMAYVPRIDAKRYVLRLNDAARGFGEMPGCLQEGLERRMADGFYSQIWAVSEPLAEHARGLTRSSRVLLVPNGVDADQFRAVGAVGTRRGGESRGRAVYVGPNVPWLDVDLVAATARLLKDWTFDVYGDGFSTAASEANLHFKGAVPHGEVAELLGGYDVGLLPYMDVRGRMRYVHRPLKFYEYYASGLGIACVDVGGLRSGIGALARYGNGPEGFARAVQDAASTAPSPEESDRFMADNSWSSRLEAVERALAELE